MDISRISYVLIVAVSTVLTCCVLIMLVRGLAEVIWATKKMPLWARIAASILLAWLVISVAVWSDSIHHEWLVPFKNWVMELTRYTPQ